MTRSGLIAGLALLVTQPALAQPGVDDATGFKALVDCRQIASDPERLACFDAAAAQLQRAEQAGDVVVFDRAEIQEARRAAFGFDALDLFRRGDRAEAPLRNVVLEAKSARVGADGRWSLVTVDGQVWKQIDDEALPKRPKAGSKLEVRTAALGSYFMNVDGQRAIRVRREQ